MNVNLHISMDELRDLCRGALDGSGSGAILALEILEVLDEPKFKDEDLIDMVF